MSAAPNALGQISSAGSMGQTQRPKNRFIDRVLMYNRDQKQQQSMMQLMAEQDATGTGAPNPMSGTPGMGMATNPGAQNLLKMIGGG
jgi:hypothetical protein